MQLLKAPEESSLSRHEENEAEIRNKISSDESYQFEMLTQPCPICLLPLKIGNSYAVDWFNCKIKKYSMKHSLHKDCAIKWIQEKGLGKVTCPECRQNFLPKKGASGFFKIIIDQEKAIGNLKSSVNLLKLQNALLRKK